MKKMKFLAALTMAAVLITSAVTPAVSVEASSTSVTTSYIGGSYSFSGVTSVQINGKNYNKLSSSLKKEVRTAKTYTAKRGFSKISSAYTAGASNVKYTKTYGVQVDFLKKGTYTIKTKSPVAKKSYNTTYGGSELSYDYTITYYDSDYNVIGTSTFSSDDYLSYSDMPAYLDTTYTSRSDYYDYYYEYDYNDVPYYYITTYDNVSGTSTVGTDKYYEATDTVGNTYYATADGSSIYAVSPDLSVYVPATLNTSGALVYQPLSYTTVTETIKVKVAKTRTPVVSSVTLGSKGKYSSSYESADGYFKSTSVNNPFLSGSKGKVTVKMGSNSKLMDIVVKTYDKNGDEVYKIYKNKKNVTFGKYAEKYTSSYKSASYSYSYVNEGLYKETVVYVFYKDKVGGGFIDIQDISKDSKTGEYTFKYKYKYSSDDTATTATSSYLPSSYCNSYTFYK
ncbi:MAG: hypothetical protein K5675_06695 [Lachnospiraceae bacterium]|nr:hypothetical protein [Lachnospiraceae bacterium]